MKKIPLIICGEQWTIEIGSKKVMGETSGQWWGDRSIIRIREDRLKEGTLYHEIVEVVTHINCMSWEPRNGNNHEGMIHVMTHAQQTSVSRDVWGALMQVYPGLKRGIRHV